MASAKRGSVLVVDDEPDARGFITATLRGAGYYVEAACDGAAALATLHARSDAAELVIVDIAMPRMTGFELLDQLRADPATAGLPVLVLSGYRDGDTKVAGLRNGANDYLTKPVDGTELLARVEAHLRTARALHSWRERALVDPLTGLLNRRGFLECLDREIERAVRHDRALAVAFFDLDGFKQINDTFGHSAGDDALRAVAAVLEGSLRACDIAARWGGDEFIAALPDADAEQAEHAVQRVQRGIEALATADLPMGISTGVACWSRTADAIPERSASALIDAADRAMYRDKLARTRGGEQQGGVL